MKKRCYRKLYALSSGAITFGWLQGFEMVSFSDIFTSLLTTLLALLATVLFGGDVSTLTT